MIFVTLEDPFARAIRAVEYLNASLPGTPIVAISTSTTTATFQQAVRAGAKFLLEAPLQPAEIAKILGTFEASTAPKPGQARGTGRVIAVVGQKGGVGKTAISVNLAAALAQNPANHVLIVDFDMSFGDVGLTMDVTSDTTTAQAAHNLSATDRDDFKRDVVAHPSGAFVLGAPTRVGEWLKVTPEQLEALVETAAALYDYVILDTPGAFSDAVATAMDLADNILIVTSLELSSVKNTALLLDVLLEEGAAGERSLIVANCTSPDTGINTIDLVPSLKRDSIWKVPYDPAIRKASQVGKPAVMANPTSPASQSILAMARRIEVSPERIDRRSEVRGEALPTEHGSVGSKLKAALSRMNRSAAA
ncbi:MAG: AAA family ATPase [Anaerolineaceae bacterium]